MKRVFIESRMELGLSIVAFGICAILGITFSHAGAVGTQKGEVLPTALGKELTIAEMCEISGGICGPCRADDWCSRPGCTSSPCYSCQEENLATFVCDGGGTSKCTSYTEDDGCGHINEDGTCIHGSCSGGSVTTAWCDRPLCSPRPT